MTCDPGRVDYLSVEDILEVASDVLDDMAVRDPGLLAAAAGRPQVSLVGRDAYPTIADKAAALMHSLARNHALVDGNKRLAWAAARVICLLSGTDLAYTVNDAESLVTAVAAGKLDGPSLAESIGAHLS